MSFSANHQRGIRQWHQPHHAVCAGVWVNFLLPVEPVGEAQLHGTLGAGVQPHHVPWLYILLHLSEHPRRDRAVAAHPSHSCGQLDGAGDHS